MDERQGRDFVCQGERRQFTIGTCGGSEVIFIMGVGMLLFRSVLGESSSPPGVEFWSGVPEEESNC